MKETIVITDGYTLNPGDLSWKDFEAIGEVVYYDRLNPEDVVSCCKEATIIITNKTPVQEELIREASRLKIIAVTATGYNIIDHASAVSWCVTYRVMVLIQ
jgi:glycerate dehydrogenase